jgi:hypothetical protein
VEVFDNVLATAGVEDPSTGAWSGWVRSYSRENLQVQRRASLRGSANASVSLSALGALPRPLVGPDTDDVDITLDAGGVLDLRGLDGAQGPLFETGAPVLIDTILLDPGVQLIDLFAPPPGLAPGATVHELFVMGRPSEFFDVGPGALVLRPINLGNAPDPVVFDWIDVLAWSFGGPVMLPLSPFELGLVQIPLQVPPVPLGTESALSVGAQPLAGQYLQYESLAVRVQLPPASQTYCTAKPNSLGCIPKIGTSGSPTWTGYDDFVIHATDVLPNKAGLVIHGSAAAQIPFSGGLLCVQPPLTRTKVSIATRLNSGAVCDGQLAHLLTQEYMQMKGLAPGTSLFAQWWSRDGQSSFATGLTDGVSFTIGP